MTDRIRHVSPRIEQAAGIMADVCHRLTGRPPAACASTGPGPMNLMIAPTDARFDNSAFLAIAGNVPTAQSAHRPDRLGRAAGRPPRCARTGPAHLDMPRELYIRTAPVRVPEPATPAGWSPTWSASRRPRR